MSFDNTGDGFSGGLKLIDPDDFITPSQACIKPVEPPKLHDGATLTLQLDGSYAETLPSGEIVPLKPATVSLSEPVAIEDADTLVPSRLL